VAPIDPVDGVAKNVAGTTVK
jgi:hypothetical protein